MTNPASWTPYEGVLEEGDPVAVYGMADWDRDGEAPRRLVMRAPPGLHLYIRKGTAASAPPASPDVVRRHRVPRARRARVADVRDGAPTTIVGRVRFAGASTEAPLSGRRVCFYEAATSAADAGYPYYTTALRTAPERHALDFLVEDDSGMALIRVDDSTYFDAPERLVPRKAERLHAFLDRRYGGANDLTGWLSFERVLEEGALVEVRGVGTWEPAADSAAPFAGYRDASRRLVMRAPAGLRLYIRKLATPSSSSPSALSSGASGAPRPPLAIPFDPKA